MRFILTLLFVFYLTACSLAPSYHRPLIDIPDTYKEDDLWQIAKPSHINANAKCWWEVFGDPVLNDLERSLNAANQDIKIALAQYEGSLAVLKIARSGFFPTVNANAQALRIQTSKNAPNPSSNSQFSDFILGSDFSYEIDVWGRVRNNVKAAKSLAKASCADLKAVELSLQANLASTYFLYRGAEERIRILTELEQAYTKALKLTLNRYEGGITPQADVYQAQTQLENVKTLRIDTQLNLAQYEHALAILVGLAPSTFSVPAAVTTNQKVIIVNPILPSTLLQRRPDIAAAEMRVQAANASIGVARAAFFPNFNLIGSLGFESAVLGTLLGAPSLYWAIGPQAAMTLFDGGKLQGQLQQVEASYHESIAFYKKTVLNALQEVEDNLAAQRELEKQNVTQANATHSANLALKQAFYRYDGGVATYLDVVVDQNIALTANLALIDIHTRRQIASVQLIKALGGLWI